MKQIDVTKDNSATPVVELTTDGKSPHVVFKDNAWCCVDNQQMTQLELVTTVEHIDRSLQTMQRELNAMMFLDAIIWFGIGSAVYLLRKRR